MNGKQLKNSILQWAIQGKLVPQDPNDEPASVLLDKIRQEKERLIKEKKIKRDKNASIIYRGEDNSYYEKMLATGEVKCIDEEVPFEIPQGWEWCRLRDIILGTNAGKSPNCEKRPKKSEEWGVLTTTSIQENAFLSNENKVLPKHYVINPEHCVRYGDILITRAGPVNRTGIVCMVENNCDKLILSDKTVRIDYMHDYCNQKFLVFVLNSSAIHELVMSATVGMAASQVNVSQSSIQNTLIPFPPSKEQQRIVNKLKALLPQIEKYDNAQNKLDELNKTVKDIIKKSVLQEAIQGKLVPQIGEEGTAKELLEQIKAEKQKLVKEGKLKKSALINSIIFRGDDNKYWEKKGATCECINEDIPFYIPISWAWVRLETILSIGSARRVHAKDWRQAGIPFYRAREIGKLADDGFVDNELYIDLSLYEDFSSSGVPLPNDLMITAVGTLGKVYIVKKNDRFYYKDGSVLCLTNKYGLCAEYLKMVIESPFFKGQYRQESQGTTVATLTMVRLQKYFIPLPPLQEQYRIVETYRNIASIMS